MKRLTKREKTLVLLIGGTGFLLFNFFFIDFAMKKNHELRTALALKTSQLQVMQTLMADRDVWMKRDEWLKRTQPKMPNESEAGVQLFEDIKRVASRYTVTPGNPTIGSLEKTSYYRTVPVRIETTSNWDSIVRFLYTLQKPSEFIVFKSADIKISAKDPSLFQGDFIVERWYAPY